MVNRFDSLILEPPFPPLPNQRYSPNLHSFSIRSIPSGFSIARDRCRDGQHTLRPAWLASARSSQWGPSSVILPTSSIINRFLIAPTQSPPPHTSKTYPYLTTIIKTHITLRSAIRLTTTAEIARTSRPQQAILHPCRACSHYRYPYLASPRPFYSSCRTCKSFFRLRCTGAFDRADRDSICW